MYLCVPDRLGYDYGSGPVIMVDVATGRQTTSTSAQELYSLSAPDGISLSQMMKSDGQAVWQLQIPGQQPITLTDANPGFADGYPAILYNVAIASDGKQVAYLKDDQLFIKRDGQTLSVPVDVKGTVWGITWGAMGWRAPHRGAPKS